LTWKGSEVRSLYRPPSQIAINSYLFDSFGKRRSKPQCRTRQELAHSFRGKPGEFDLAPFMVKSKAQGRTLASLSTEDWFGTTPAFITPTALSIEERLRSKGLASRAPPLARSACSILYSAKTRFLQAAEDQTSGPHARTVWSIGRPNTAAQLSLVAAICSSS
jgi:hypothetical protein